MALISEEEIGLCRSGPNNDIDLQAVYGGRISGKKEKDLKVNPLYSDRNTVTQYPDVNRNMSPVHVVSYESFPGTRTKPQSSENGIIQNGDVLQHTEVNRTENTSSKSEHNTVFGSLNNNSDIIDPNHNAEDTKDKRLNEEKNNVPKLVYLKYKDSKSCEEYSAVNRDNGRDKCSVDTVYIESKKLNSQNSKGFHKDYSLLSYNNKSFVLDEKDVVIIPEQIKETNPNTNQYHEIQSLSNHKRTNSVELEDQAEAGSSEAENSVNPNSLKEDELDLNDSNSTETAPPEKANSEGLPESMYHEISNVCDMQKLGHHNIETIHDLSGNSQGESFDTGDSPQKCHKEIITEVLVHNSAVLESPRMILYSSYSEGKPFSFDAKNIKGEVPEQAYSSDWPEIDELVRPVQAEKLETPVTGFAQSDESRMDTKGHIRSVSDIVIQEKETNEGTENKEDRYSDMNGSSVYKKRQSKVKSGSNAGVVSEAGSSTRTLKSILSNNSSYHSCPSEIDQKRQNSYSEIHELKTVKFSEDTVFNENKSNKYKKEKFGQINLRDLYRGKIMSEAAVAKMNPLYCSDEGTIEGGEQDADDNSEIDNDKLTYQLTLKNAMRLSKGKPASFNSPSYLEQYLILKAHGIKKDDMDIERLPETMEKPVYDRLIQRTLAKERRKVCVKWSMVIITVAVITAVATTLGVYFKEGF